MKHSISITLIIVGGLLIVAPLISDHLQRQQQVTALSRPGVQSVSLQPQMSELYRFGCWLTGTVGIAAALQFARRQSNTRDLEVVQK